MKKILASVLSLTVLSCGSAQSESTTATTPTTRATTDLPLAEMPIEAIVSSAAATGALEVKVNFEIQPCRHTFVGIHFEDVSDRIILAETKLKVRVLAVDKGLSCRGALLKIEKTATITPVASGFYTFVK